MHREFVVGKGENIFPKIQTFLQRGKCYSFQLLAQMFEIYVSNRSSSESGIMGLWGELGLGLQLQKQILQLTIYLHQLCSNLHLPVEIATYQIC